MKSMRLSRLAWIGMILLVLSFSSCEQHAALQEKSFDDHCWQSGDTLDLVFSNPDTQKVYALQFPLVFTDDYPYNNIYIRAIVRAPSGDQNTLPARFDLMDPTGEWRTEPSGDEVAFELNIGDGLRFNQTGEYTIRLFHYMRDERLCGISKIGIALDEMVNN